MSARIDIIQDGYSFKVEVDDVNKIVAAPLTGSKVQKACGSCCLVRSSGIIVLFDTMGPWKRDLLLEKLANLKIHPDDLDYVIGSHGHADHIGNMNLFSNCKRQFIGICSYHKDIYFEDCFFRRSVRMDSGEGQSESNDLYTDTYLPSFGIDKNLMIKATPGHTNEDVSLMIENCDNYGQVALAGDLFECCEDVENESLWIDAGSNDQRAQKHNRDEIYHAVDWILPGHGPIFKTKRSLKKE